MKTFITSFIALCAATTAMAQEVADTITINNPNKVVITQSDNSLSVTVSGLPDESDYLLERNLTVADSAVSTSYVSDIKHDGLSWDFGSAEKEDNGRITLDISPKIEYGLTTPIGGPSDMKTGFFKSGELRADLMCFDFVPARGRWNFHLEFGISYTSLRLKGDRRFLADADNHLTILPYPADAQEKNRNSYLFNIGASIKLMAHYSVGKYSYIGFGPMWTIPAANFGSSCRSIYTDADGKKQSHMHRLDTQLNNVGLRFEYLPIRNFKIYATYSPWSSISKQTFGNFGSFSLGIGFGF